MLVMVRLRAVGGLGLRLSGGLPDPLAPAPRECLQDHRLLRENSRDPLHLGGGAGLHHRLPRSVLLKI